MRPRDEPWLRRAIWVSAAAGLVAVLVGIGGTLTLRVRHDAAIDGRQAAAAEDAATLAREIEFQVEARLAQLRPLAQSPAVTEQDTAGVQRTLAGLQLATLDIDGVAWVDAAGASRAKSGVLEGPPATSGIVQAVRTSSKPAIAITGASTNGGEPLLMAAVPTYDQSGGFTGAVVSQVPLGREGVLTVEQLPGGWSSAVVDAGGGVVMTDGTPVAARPGAAPSTLGSARATGSGVFADATAVTGEAGNIVGFAPIGAGGWTVFAEQDRGAAIGAATTEYRFGLPALWAFMVALVGAAGFIAWRRGVAGERRRAALEAVTYGERMLRSFADGMPIIAWRTPADGRGSFVNVAYREYFGTEQPKAVTELPCHPDDKDRLADVAEHLGEEGHGETEVRLLRGDGDARWHVLRAEAVLTPEAATICAAADIDDLRHALLVKDEFLALVSHELRTPLTVIIGNAEILRRRDAELEPAVRKELEEGISEQGDNLRGLIENMLVLSQLQSGATGPAEPQLLQRLAPIVANAFRAEAPEVELRVTVDETVPPVDMHVVTVQQVLINLLSNARKYGGKEVELRVGWRGGRVFAAVLDRGPGIPEAEASRLFTPYFRSSTTAETTSGLGLGLAVCQRLVEASGGTMFAERREGGGMEIGFCVPPSPL